MSQLTSAVTVPFCYLPNTLAQVFRPETCKRTEFQVNALAEIASRPNFAYFVTMQDTDGHFVAHPDFKGWFNVMWYDKEGGCHAAEIGQVHMLRPERLVGKSSPVPLDGPVYACRVKAS